MKDTAAAAPATGNIGLKGIVAGNLIFRLQKCMPKIVNCRRANWGYRNLYNLPNGICKDTTTIGRKRRTEKI